jgi:hypothetical protein
LKPSVLHVELGATPPSSTVAKADHTGNYRATMESLVALMKEELGLPFPPRVSLYLYPNDLVFERGLQEEAGFAPASAVRTAGYASAVATNGKVLVNEVDVARVPWKRCVEILAHELVHVSQYHLAGGWRGRSLQWLREGFAEWGTAAALDRLGFEPREVRFAKARGKVRWVSEGGDLPTLRQLMNPPGWAAVQEKPDGAASYELAMLATDFLISRIGIPAVIQYFRDSAVLDPRGNFAQAFGQSFFEFEAEFMMHLKEILR